MGKTLPGNVLQGNRCLTAKQRYSLRPHDSAPRRLLSAWHLHRYSKPVNPCGRRAFCVGSHAKVISCYSHRMIEKGTPIATEAVLVGTRVPPEVRVKFAELARQHSRTQSGELRVLIERHILEHEGGTDSE